MSVRASPCSPSACSGERVLERAVGGGQRRRRFRRHAHAIETAPRPARETDVEQLRPAPACEHHVGGLQVAVHQAVPVDLGQRVADGDGEGHGVVHAQPAARQTIREATPLDELEGEVGLPEVVADVVDSRDAGMGNGRRDERVGEQGVAHHAGRQHLQQHRSPQSVVVRVEGVTEAAVPEVPHDAVQPDLPRHRAPVYLSDSPARGRSIPAGSRARKPIIPCPLTTAATSRCSGATASSACCGPDSSSASSVTGSTPSPSTRYCSA